jgi:molecular chaperone GrpE
MTEERKAPEAAGRQPDPDVATGGRQPPPASARPDAERAQAGADAERAEAGEPERPEAAARPQAPDAERARASDAERPQAPDAERPPAPDAEPEEEQQDHEAKLEHDLEELAAKAEKADEYLELAQRTKADFENYRKRAAREASAAQERGIVKLALELLPAVDDLDRALQATDGADESDTLASGVKLVHAGVLAALARMGIEPYSPKGERFDPQCHEAVAQQPVDGAETGTIVEVYQRGYRLGDAILRPARVVVAG